MQEPDEQIITLGPAQFDTQTGRLLRLHGMEVDGPRLELWRGPTDNDRGSTSSWLDSADRRTLSAKNDGPSSEQRWRERGDSTHCSTGLITSMSIMINCWPSYESRRLEATFTLMSAITGG